MGRISARVPDDLEDALETYLEEERMDRSTAIRQLLAEGLEEGQHERAVRKPKAGEVSFAREAELAGLSLGAREGIARVYDRPPFK